MKRFVFFILFVLILFQLVAEVKSIIVDTFEITANAITKEEAESITELYIAELIDTGKVVLVDRAILDRQLKNMRFQSDDWANAYKTAKLGKALNVQLVSRGKIVRLGSKFYLSTTLINMETAQAISSSRVQFSSLDELPDLLVGCAKSVVDGLSIKIGDIGLGGGFVFYIEGDKALECSELLGAADWNTAKEMCKNYRGGGYDDWYLPSKDELNHIYINLRKVGKIAGDDWYWSSSPFNNYYAWGQLFSIGHSGCDDMEKPNAVRAVRSFSLLPE